MVIIWWKKLEPHLPEEGVCTKMIEDQALTMLDCREIPDETTYQKILEIAKTNCPDLVQEIEKHKRVSDAHQ